MYIYYHELRCEDIQITIHLAFDVILGTIDYKVPVRKEDMEAMKGVCSTDNPVYTKGVLQQTLQLCWTMT